MKRGLPFAWLIVLLASAESYCQSRRAPDFEVFNTEEFRMKDLAGTKHIGAVTKLTLRESYYGGGLDTAELTTSTFDLKKRKYTRTTRLFLNNDQEFIPEGTVYFEGRPDDPKLPEMRVECLYNRDSQLIDYKKFLVLSSWAKEAKRVDSLVGHLTYRYNADGNLLSESDHGTARFRLSYIHDTSGRVTRAYCTWPPVNGTAQQRELHFHYDPHRIIGQDDFWRYVTDTEQAPASPNMSTLTRYYYNSSGQQDSSTRAYGVNLSSTVYDRQGDSITTVISRYDYTRSNSTDTLVYRYRTGSLEIFHMQDGLKERYLYFYDRQGRAVEEQHYLFQGHIDHQHDPWLCSQTLYFYGDGGDAITAKRNLLLYPRRD